MSEPETHRTQDTFACWFWAHRVAQSYDVVEKRGIIEDGERKFTYPDRLDRISYTYSWPMTEGHWCESIPFFKVMDPESGQQGQSWKVQQWIRKLLPKAHMAGGSSLFQLALYVAV